MFLVRRWWGCVWPWPLGAAAPQLPVWSSSTFARSSWAGELTVDLRAVLTFGQRAGYRAAERRP